MFSKLFYFSHAVSHHLRNMEKGCVLSVALIRYRLARKYPAKALDLRYINIIACLISLIGLIEV